MPQTPAIRAVIFDAYGTLFDVYSVASLAEQMFPGKGADLARLWRQKQLEYTWLRTLSGRYLPFWEVTRDALHFAIASLALRTDAAGEKRLLNQYASLSAFPENIAVLKALQGAGLPLAILSNGDPAMLGVSVRSAGMEGLFAHLLSADTVRRYKTADEVYALGPQALGLPAANILFVSSNSWDAIGASWYGYPAFWINRAGQPLDQLGCEPLARGESLTDVVRFVQSHAAARSRSA